MGKNKRKNGAVHWDRQNLENGSGKHSCLPAIRGNVDVTEALCHIIDSTCNAYYRLGYEHGKASASVPHVVADSDSSSLDTT